MEQAFEELANLVGRALADRWLRARQSPRRDSEKGSATPMLDPAVAMDGRAGPPPPPCQNGRDP
jgi:hypothetical protein